MRMVMSVVVVAMMGRHQNSCAGQLGTAAGSI
jgi:hypothetical protein